MIPNCGRHQVLRFVLELILLMAGVVVALMVIMPPLVSSGILSWPQPPDRAELAVPFTASPVEVRFLSEGVWTDWTPTAFPGMKSPDDVCLTSLPADRAEVRIRPGLEGLVMSVGGDAAGLKLTTGEGFVEVTGQGQTSVFFGSQLEPQGHYLCRLELRK